MASEDAPRVDARMGEQDLRDAGLMVDVPWETPMPGRLRYSQNVPADKAYVGPDDPPIEVPDDMNPEDDAAPPGAKQSPDQAPPSEQTDARESGGQA